ncbi:MAG: hypothetical protein AMJ84_08645, partial [Acidithiobacillales bacterium SM23_46]
MPASDYFIDIGDPFAKSIAAFRGGYGDVETLRRFDEERQERQRVAQERQSGMDALQNLARLGNNATSGDYMSALAANPAFGQQIGAMQKTFGAERSANELRFGQQLFSVLAGDNTDLSKQMLDERIAAYRNAGDNRSADSAQAIRLMLDKPGGLDAARASVGLTLANGMGAPEFKAFFEQFYPRQKEMTAETRGRLEQLRLAGIDPASKEGRRFLLTGSLGEQFRPATPEEAARYGASAGQVDTETGRFYPINPPTGFVVETTAEGGTRIVQGPGAGQTFREQESKDIVYAARAEGALADLEPVAEELANLAPRLFEYVPLGQGRQFQSPEYQRANVAAMEFLAAILRKDTGAAITQKEIDIYGQTYLPQPGDSPQALEQKTRARRRAIDALRAPMSKAAQGAVAGALDVSIPQG